MPDVSVYFADMESADPGEFLTKVSSYLPSTIIAELNGFGSVKKKISFSAGRRMLMKILEIKGYPEEKISEIKKDSYGKPFFENGPFFNISHSNSLVVCAVSEKQAIGVDVERVREIKPENFQKYLHYDEWTLLKQNNFNRELFFGIWTKKEAALKATGVGIRIPIWEVNTIQHPVLVNGSPVTIKEIKTEINYAGHLALAAEGAFTVSCEKIEL